MIGGCATSSCHHGAAGAGPVDLELKKRPTARRAADIPWYHLVDADSPLVFLVESSAVFEVTEDVLTGLARHDPQAQAELARYRRKDPSLNDIGQLPAPRAVSLNVAQSCNLSCSYCYADEGRFGGSPRRMSAAVARRAVDELVSSAAPGDGVLIGFIGGEPMLNRSLVHDCVGYATARAAAASVTVRFSVTTNATLLTPADRDLFRAHPFAVTVSADGGRDTHDRHRRRHDGTGSWQHTIDGVADLLAEPGLARISARATVTRDNLDIAGIVEELTAVGFPEVGVSPTRTGPDPSLVIADEDWPRYLSGLVEAADAEIARLRAQPSHRTWRFSNLGQAMTEIHRGTARPLPCGAAYGYLSVDVDGRYSTCHRTVGDGRFDVGELGALSNEARSAFLTARMVDRQEPCRSCWARYLCGGGCHAEVSAAGRDSCDMIRGWLDFCLAHYPALRTEFPELFITAPTTKGADRP